MKKKPLSFSAYKKYHECPKKFDLHYNKRLRSETEFAFFIFGSAIDKGCNELLESISDSKKDNEKKLEEAVAAASKELARLEVTKVEYDERDWDYELIQDREALLNKLKKAGYQGDDVNKLVWALLDKIKEGTELSPGQTKALAIAMRASFEEKAKILLAGYQRQVLPKVSKIYKVQKEVKRGIADAEVELQGIEGKIVLDNKTSWKFYDEDSVRTSVQLAGYEADQGAYVVMDKNIKKNRIKTCEECGTIATGSHHTCNSKAIAERKAIKLVKGEEVEYTIKVGDRCNGEFSETIDPEAVIQIVHDTILESQRKLVETSFQDTEKAIEAGCFPRNLQGCIQWFGKKKAKCEFYDYCRSNNQHGLYVKKDEK